MMYEDHSNRADRAPRQRHSPAATSTADQMSAWDREAYEIILPWVSIGAADLPAFLPGARPKSPSRL